MPWTLDVNVLKDSVVEPAGPTTTSGHASMRAIFRPALR